MCLERVFTKKEREEILAKLPDEFTVWKVVANMERYYMTDCRCLTIHAGEMQFKTNTIDEGGIKYKGGGHFWLHKKDAVDWVTGYWATGYWATGYSEGYSEKVVRCKIRKKWITNMGIQNDGIVVIVRKAIFPKYIGQMGTKISRKT